MHGTINIKYKEINWKIFHLDFWLGYRWVDNRVHCTLLIVCLFGVWNLCCWDCWLGTLEVFKEWNPDYITPGSFCVLFAPLSSLAGLRSLAPNSPYWIKRCLDIYVCDVAKTVLAVVFYVFPWLVFWHMCLVLKLFELWVWNKLWCQLNIQFDGWYVNISI